MACRLARPPITCWVPKQVSWLQQGAHPFSPPVSTSPPENGPVSARAPTRTHSPDLRLFASPPVFCLVLLRGGGDRRTRPPFRRPLCHRSARLLPLAASALQAAASFPLASRPRKEVCWGVCCRWMLVKFSVCHAWVCVGIQIPRPGSLTLQGFDSNRFSQGFGLRNP